MENNTLIKPPLNFNKKNYKNKILITSINSIKKKYSNVYLNSKKNYSNINDKI
jgi:hypothetical protein